MVTLFANNVVAGNSTLIDLPEGATGDQIEQILERFSDGQDGHPVVLSSEPFAPHEAGGAEEPGETELLSSDSETSKLPAPQVPKPQGPTVFPPETSEELIVSTNRVSGLYVAVGTTYFPVSSYRSEPPFPETVYAQFSTYWQRVGEASIVGPQTYTKEISFETGMSVTDSTTLAAELGVSLGDLSAKLSATISHTVTTSEKKTITDSYQIPVGAGEIAVYALWQLIGKIRFLGADKQPIIWNGALYFGGVRLNATFPNERRLSNLNTVYSDRTDFKN